MACFIVPGTEAVVTTIATKVLEGKNAESKIVPKLKTLNNLLWGGSGLLAFEHLWHGEIQPFFPFLTAASNPADAMEMLHEMSTVGVSMAVLVTAVWGVMAYVTSKMEEKAPEEEAAREV